MKHGLRWGIGALMTLGSLWLSGRAEASGMERLEWFMQQTRTGQAHFIQTRLGSGSGKARVSSGMFSFARPGRFRWEYQQPFPQTLVGDGRALWIWDPDLRQVTRKKLASSLGSTPAALLAGQSGLDQGFRLEEAPPGGGLEWVLATPRTHESGFERVRLGFDARALVQMELTDSFGQVVQIVFDHFETPPHLAPELFHFTPPADADVIE